MIQPNLGEKKKHYCTIIHIFQYYSMTISVCSRFLDLKISWLIKRYFPSEILFFISPIPFTLFYSPTVKRRFFYTTKSKTFDNCVKQSHKHASKKQNASVEIPNDSWFFFTTTQSLLNKWISELIFYSWKKWLHESTKSNSIQLQWEILSSLQLIQC